jgi:7-cyano-7-deazaguanine synthase
LLRVRHDVVDLRGVGGLLSEGGSALIDDEVAVPDGHYADESMRATVVPNRNMIMLAVAGGIAVARRLESVAYAAHAGDHAIYPDCRPEFANAVGEALELCDWHPVRLWTPYVAKTKAQIAARAGAIGVPIAATWSCYKGGAVHCGTCGTCVERREAFYLAGVTDPTAYESAPNA